MQLDDDALMEIGETVARVTAGQLALAGCMTYGALDVAKIMAFAVFRMGDRDQVFYNAFRDAIAGGGITTDGPADAS